MSKDHQQHALYRFYDDRDRLLYIGITVNPGPRWRKHRDGKPWWHHVSNVTIEHHPTRGAVLRAERAAIITEHPRHNVVHNRGDQTPERPLDVLERMTDWPSWGSESDDMPDICHDQCRTTRAVYFPYVWDQGLGYYQCERGHQWWCKWGHKKSGRVPENAGKNQCPVDA